VNIFKLLVCFAVIATYGCDRSQPTPPVASNPTPPVATNNTPVVDPVPVTDSDFQADREPETSDDHYAFLVGVKEYDKTQLTSLSYTEADVTALAAALKTAGYDEANIVLMTQTLGASSVRQLPTSERIRKELDLLLGELDSDDTLLLAFSGHGVQFKDEASVYFCPMDANLSERNTLISLEDVYGLLSDRQKCKAQTKILLVDACRNDPQSRLSKAGREIELEPAGVTQQPDPPGGVAAFYSCSRGEKSYEHPDLEHGIFANFVIEAFSGKGDLDKDGELSLAELEQYSVKQTQRFARVELGERQTPERRGTTRGLTPLGSFGSTSSTMQNSIGMKLALIPGGEFLMGSPASEVGRRDAESQHRVRITKPFYMGIHEVTVGQFKRFVAATNYKTEAETDGKGGWGYEKSAGVTQDVKYSWRSHGFPQVDAHPVINVSWNDSVAFCTWLSRAEGVEYRLPTEAEWEYACRAGTNTMYYHGNDAEGLVAVGNVADRSFQKDFPSFTHAIAADDGFVSTSPVGRFRANGFGLYDMHGNVLEWCSDWYGGDYYESSPRNDPAGPPGGSDRVIRGGSWSYPADYCRSAFRLGDLPSYRNGRLGFRVVRSSKK